MLWSGDIGGLLVYFHLSLTLVLTLEVGMLRRPRDQFSTLRSHCGHTRPPKWAESMKNPKRMLLDIYARVLLGSDDWGTCYFFCCKKKPIQESFDTSIFGGQRDGLVKLHAVQAPQYATSFGTWRVFYPELGLLWSTKTEIPSEVLQDSLSLLLWWSNMGTHKKWGTHQLRWVALIVNGWSKWYCCLCLEVSLVG